MTKIAIVGSGIAGLGLAYYLRDQFDIDIYERNAYAGGHTNTVDVLENQTQIPIDTGFMVYNKVTYPNLTKLFDDLGVRVQKTDMSFSVQHLPARLEYSGASPSRLFGDRSNLFNVRFMRMLLELNRFNKEAIEALNDESIRYMSLREYLLDRRFGSDLTNLYLVPMCSALWSTPPDKMLDFPIITLLRFFYNHGLFGIETQHQWWTVAGGSREYVRLLLKQLRSTPRLSLPVISVCKSERQVSIITEDGHSQPYDKVVLACHADEALNLLYSPTSLESKLLSAFKYEKNLVTLHTDEAVMPRTRRCWASWNYRLDSHPQSASTHYWMNSLQNVSEHRNYFVSVNGKHLIDKNKILKEIVFDHPLFSTEALKAQNSLHRLNEESPNQQIFFCGSYFRFGFHEDALTSALTLAHHLQELPVKI